VFNFIPLKLVDKLAMLNPNVFCFSPMWSTLFLLHLSSTSLMPSSCQMWWITLESRYQSWFFSTFFPNLVNVTSTSFSLFPCSTYITCLHCDHCGFVDLLYGTCVCSTLKCGCMCHRCRNKLGVMFDIVVESVITFIVPRMSQVANLKVSTSLSSSFKEVFELRC
jgi:hypothetical protein